MFNSTPANISRFWSMLGILEPFAFSVFLFCHPFEGRDSLKNERFTKRSGKIDRWITNVGYTFFMELERSYVITLNQYLIIFWRTSSFFLDISFFLLLYSSSLFHTRTWWQEGNPERKSPTKKNSPVKILNGTPQSLDVVRTEVELAGCGSHLINRPRPRPSKNEIPWSVLRETNFAFGEIA